ncbi:MAG: SRPBCC family protein [Deltaproteobacteria bacterium]|nr:SRPBCC family protein [Deltaproteobacteria bacterium]
MLWIALYVVAGLAGLVALLALVGLAIPVGHVSARAATLAAPPEQVWAALADVAGYARWRRDLKRVEVISTTAFREHGAHGAIAFEVVEARAPELRITRIADDKLPFGGRWIYELVREGGGTRVAITEDGTISNPVFRTMSRTVFSTASTLEKFLTDLAAHLGVDADVAPCEPSRLASRAAS